MLLKEISINPLPPTPRPPGPVELLPVFSCLALRLGPPRTASNSGIVFGIHFSDYCSILAPFSAPFWPPLSIILASFFEHRFRIDFSLISDRILPSFLMFFWWVFRSRIHLARNLANLILEQHYNVLRSKSRFYPFRKIWIFMIFMIFFDTCFGIGFLLVLASISAPFWEPFGVVFHVFLGSIFEWIFGGVVDGFWTKMAPKSEPRYPPFAPLFRYFSAGCVFEGSLPHFGSLLAPFWLPLAPFWLPLAPFWIPLAPFWALFGSLLVPKSLKEFFVWNTFGKAPENNTTHPDLRTPPSLKARSGTLPQANSINRYIYIYIYICQCSIGNLTTLRPHADEVYLGIPGSRGQWISMFW